MRKPVRTADGRTWMVDSRISWTRPQRADQFEHDMAAGYLPGAAMMGVILVLTLFVVLWTPAGVVIPGWFVLLILLVLLLVPVWWALQRPWVITARTDEPIPAEGEHWEVIVRGIISAREEAHQIIDDLRTRGVPGTGTGRLAQIKSPTAPFPDA